MLLPIGRDDAEIRRHAWVCYVIFALNILMFVGVSAAERESMRRAAAAWQQAIEYHVQHPYLETPDAMKKLIGREGVAYLAQRRSSFANVPRDRMQSEQRELDEQTAAAEEARREQPKVRLGYIPADGSFLTILTSIFVHGGVMHLLGNLLYLFLSGPFVEDVFGRPLFALLYFGGGIAATLTYGANNPDSIVPLVGASGAIAAVMGAYLVRFARSKVEFLLIPFWFRPQWHFRFWMPAFVVLPIWFGQQLLGMLVEQHSDVGFSAHVGGFVFGIVFALLVMLTKVEEKWVNPAVLQQTTWSLDERVVRAMDARHRGDVVSAKRELASVLRDGNASVEALQLNIDLARDSEDPAAFDAASARLLAHYIEQKDTTLATDLIREVADDRFAHLPKFLARAAPFIERSGDREWALALYERLYDADPNGSGAVSVLMKMGALRKHLGDFAGAREALTKARQHPACTAEWIASIDAKLAQLG